MDPTERSPILDQVRSGMVRHLNLEGYVTADENAPVEQVLSLMRSQDRTTALITRGSRLAGIFTERDVLQKVITRPDVLGQPIRELMTADPVVIDPGLNILGALRLMTQRHFRDLPVVDRDGRILGNLTDNAIVQFLADGMQADVLNLPPNPNQVAKTPEGA